MLKQFWNRFLIQNIKRYSSSYEFQMPECYQKSFYLANATADQKLNWFFYCAVETAFEQFVHKLKKLSPSLEEKQAVISILNKIAVLEPCDFVMEVNFPLMKDSGRVELIKGFCASHGTFSQVHLGGLRLSEKVEKSDLKALAALSTFNHMCIDVPFAGSHSAVKINPRNYSKNELKRIITDFTSLIVEKRFCGSNTNIFKPDFNCSEQIIESVVDELKKIPGNEQKHLSCITGKPASLGGFLNYNESLALSIFHTIDNFIYNEVFMNALKMPIGWKNKTYIIKDLNKQSEYLIKLLVENEAICVGISESNVSYYNESGIDVQAAVKHKQRFGTLINYFPVYNPGKIISEKCDLLILTDPTFQLNCYLAPKVEAKVVVEGTALCISPTAQKVLLGRQRLILPDICTCSGPSIASHLEYLRNNSVSAPTHHLLNDKSAPFLLSDYNLKYLEPQMDTGIQFCPELDDQQEEVVNIIEPAIRLRIRTLTKKILDNLHNYKLQSDIRTAAYILSIEKMLNLQQSKIIRR